MKIGELVVKIPVLLAPLAGITDRSFRGICRRLGAGMVFSEMISAEAILRFSAKTWNLARFQPEERPISVQIFSHDPEALAGAAARLEELQPDAIDLNFGCPARRVVHRGAGAAFLNDLDRLSPAVRRVVQSTTRPVTVKLRSGPASDQLTAVEAACRAQDEGASAVIVHGRTAKQGFKDRADWGIITQVKEAIKIPVVGNGDVFCAEDMLRMREQTGCNAVMIGRGALGNPWIFSACRAVLTNQTWSPPTPSQKWKVLEEHFLITLADKGDRIGVREMRKHLGWYSKGLPGAAQFRARVFRMSDPQQVLKTSREFFLKL